MNQSTPSQLPASGGTIVVRTENSASTSFFNRLLLLFLIGSLLLNFSLYSAWGQYFAAQNPPRERFHSGDATASEKLAVLKVSGTIMPPFTERLLRQIKHVKNDDNVKGMVLEVDSPGGLVADSHQIYHRLKQLVGEKPMFVAMKRIAASGGYYIAMGGGEETRIFAEPTTWTGSIGVILPRYDMSQFAEKVGIDSVPLTTGPFKDSLNPFREPRADEEELWREIIDDSFDRFVEVIEQNRANLSEEDVRKLATGQVYTAQQALENGLVDEIGYMDDVIAALKEHLSMDEARVVSYEQQAGLIDLLFGAKQQQNDPFQRLLDASVPRAMYFCSWGLPLPVAQ